MSDNCFLTIFTDTWQIPVVDSHSHLANCNTLASHDSVLSGRMEIQKSPYAMGIINGATTSCLRPDLHWCFHLHSESYFNARCVVVSNPGVSNKDYIPGQNDRDPD